ncbi:hypothetical protein D3C80_1086660 [compost metagenome]
MQLLFQVIAQVHQCINGVGLGSMLTLVTCLCIAHRLQLTFQFSLTCFQQGNGFGLCSVGPLGLSLQFVHILQLAFKFGFQFRLAHAQRSDALILLGNILIARVLQQAHFLFLIL